MASTFFIILAPILEDHDASLLIVTLWEPEVTIWVVSLSTMQGQSDKGTEAQSKKGIEERRDRMECFFCFVPLPLCPFVPLFIRPLSLKVCL
jgi:hypothetical protein